MMIVCAGKTSVSRGVFRTPGRHRAWRLVSSSSSSSSATKSTGTTFADRARVRVRAGNGGMGNIAFEAIPGARRTSYGWRASGGNGGRGGDVIIEATSSLESLKTQNGIEIAAAPGGHGKSSLRHGAKGADAVYRVPCGTVVRVRRDDGARSLTQQRPTEEEEEEEEEDDDDDSSAERRPRPDDGFFVKEDDDSEESVVEEVSLDADGEAVIVARGGRGSAGNAALSKAKRKQLESFGHVPSEPGEQRLVDLEIRTIADVGLCGKPNAGKSSLLRALSNATPEVASYPFTTLSPHVGVCEFRKRDARTGAVVDLDTADVPGLIEGASEGRGLGIEFLRHVYRSKALVFVLDASDGVDAALEDLAVLHGEIATSKWQGYDDDDDFDDGGQTRRRVSPYGRPAIVFANKLDLLPDDDARATLVRHVADALQPFPWFLDVLGGSAKTGLTVPALANRMRRLVRVDLAPKSGLPARA